MAVQRDNMISITLRQEILIFILIVIFHNIQSNSFFILNLKITFKCRINRRFTLSNVHIFIVFNCTFLLGSLLLLLLLLLLITIAVNNTKPQGKF